MDYPKEIVCRSTYQSSFPIDKLKISDYCVTRRIEGKIDDNVTSFNSGEVLDPDCLGPIVEMSVNLLGGLFLPEHTVLIQTGKGKAAWDGKTDIDVDGFNDCYMVHTGDFVYYRCGDLHHADYPNNYKFASKEPYRTYHQFVGKAIKEAFNQERTVSMPVTLLLVSDPTNLNYWHFIMNIILKENGEKLKNDRSFRGMIFNHILTHVLCRKFMRDNATTGNIAPEIYTVPTP